MLQLCLFYSHLMLFDTFISRVAQNNHSKLALYSEQLLTFVHEFDALPWQGPGSAITSPLGAAYYSPPGAAVYGGPAYTSEPVERQVIPEHVTVPQQVTSMVPQTTFQNKLIQVPVTQQVRVPRQYMETQTYQYQVPKIEYETQTYQVPKTVMVPQTTLETRVQQVPRQSFEMKTGTVQVPRMTEEVQNVVSYQNQTIQEPVQVMVPQTHVVNHVQQVNRVVEYARTPVRQYSVPGPSYQVPGPSYQVPGAMAPVAAAGYGMASVAPAYVAGGALPASWQQRRSYPLSLY